MARCFRSILADGITGEQRDKLVERYRDGMEHWTHHFAKDFDRFSNNWGVFYNQFKEAMDLGHEIVDQCQGLLTMNRLARWETLQREPVDANERISLRQHDDYLSMLAAHDWSWQYADRTPKGAVEFDRRLEAISKRHPHYAAMWEIASEYGGTHGERAKPELEKLRKSCAKEGKGKKNAVRKGG